MKFLNKTLFFLTIQFSVHSWSLTAFVDLRDIRDFSTSSEERLLATSILSLLKSNSVLLPTEVRIPNIGLNQQNISTLHDNVVLFLAFDESSQIVLLIRKNQELVIRTIPYTSSSHQFDIGNIKDQNAKTGFWKIQIHAVDRLIVLKNESLSFQQILPIGVSGFSKDLKSLRLPPSSGRIQKIFSSQSGIDFSRTEPAYYLGYPFLKLLDPKGNFYSGYGLHADLSPGHLKRGFMSTGCIRLRSQDIYELYYLAEALDESFIDVQVRYQFERHFTHPYPFHNSSYKTVDENTAPGDDGLTPMKEVLAPVDELLQNLASIPN